MKKVFICTAVLMLAAVVVITSTYIKLVDTKTELVQVKKEKTSQEYVIYDLYSYLEPEEGQYDEEHNVLYISAYTKVEGKELVDYIPEFIKFDKIKYCSGSLIGIECYLAYSTEKETAYRFQDVYSNQEHLIHIPK